MRTESVTRRFGTPESFQLRKTEWKRLGVFLAFGLAAFLFAVVGAAFVPLGLPDTLRRWAHPTIFVPLGTLITARMLRRDANDVPKSELFSPWPVGMSSAGWLVAGVALLAATIPVFVIAFGLRWSANQAFSSTATALTLWGVVITAAAEEIAFRGYAFWKLIRLMGFWRSGHRRRIVRRVASHAWRVRVATSSRRHRRRLVAFWGRVCANANPRRANRHSHWVELIPASATKPARPVCDAPNSALPKCTIDGRARTDVRLCRTGASNSVACQVAQLFLEAMLPMAVAAAAIAEQQQLRSTPVLPLSHPLPPSPDALARQFAVSCAAG